MPGENYVQAPQELLHVRNGNMDFHRHNHL